MSRGCPSTRPCRSDAARNCATRRRPLRGTRGRARRAARRRCFPSTQRCRPAQSAIMPLASVHRAEHTVWRVQLPGAVIAPTHHRAARAHPATVCIAGAYVVERFAQRLRPAVVPVAPTPDHARVQQSAYMDRARRDRCHAPPRLRSRAPPIHSSAKRCERNHHRSPNSCQPRHAAPSGHPAGRQARPAPPARQCGLLRDGFSQRSRAEVRPLTPAKTSPIADPSSSAVSTHTTPSRRRNLAASGLPASE